MVTVLAHLRAKRGEGEAVERILTEIVSAARAFDGCIDVRVVRELDDSDQLVIFEKWRDRADFEKFAAVGAEHGPAAKLVKHLQKEPAIRFFEDANI